MKKLIVNCKTGEKKYIDMSSEEEKRRLDEIEVAKQLEQERLNKENLRNEAIARLKLSFDRNIQDLMLVLGVD